jgi:hypothetical protein
MATRDEVLQMLQQISASNAQRAADVSTYAPQALNVGQRYTPRGNLFVSTPGYTQAAQASQAAATNLANAKTQLRAPAQYIDPTFSISLPSWLQLSTVTPSQYQLNPNAYIQNPNYAADLKAYNDARSGADAILAARTGNLAQASQYERQLKRGAQDVRSQESRAQQIPALKQMAVDRVRSAMAQRNQTPKELQVPGADSLSLDALLAMSGGK